ncbi:MAG: glycosyltransferase family 39 protein, partial [Flavobacteriaceae bacterium]|nr:glycosyltransferase family 39 protein [Flavobacteriaceae bacterium]
MKNSVNRLIHHLEHRANSTWLVYFIVITALINLLQSVFTGILNDEAYYWYYAQAPAWGYFDHPPMVAWWIYFGNVLFEGTLGIRLLAIGTYAFLLLVLSRILNLTQYPKTIPLFIAVCIGFVMMNLYGFIMVPDTPMLFFAAAFLWLYKLFLEKESWPLVLLLGIAMVGMVYSKYHSVLFLILVVFANLKLLKNLKFLTAILLSLFLFIPHFWWLIAHEWAPIQYHFVDRSANEFKWSNVLNTLINVLAVSGLLSPLLIYALIKMSAKNIFERTLKIVFWGFVAFFVYQSFKSKTQAQWFILLLFPLIYLGVKYAVDNYKLKRWIFILSGITLAI